MWQFTPWVLLYFVAAAITTFITILSWRMRPARGTTYFSLLGAAITIWTVGYTLGFFNTNLAWKQAMLRVEYLGIASTGVFWMLFILAYSQYDRWLTPLRITILSIVPAIGYLLVLTSPWHDLFYRSYELVARDNLVVSDKVYGPGFYAFSGYIYGFFLLSTLILIQAALRFPAMFRGQAALLIAASLTPALSNTMYIMGNNIIAPYDPSPIAFSIAGGLILFGMWRFKFLDVAPVAHHLVFQNVKSGVIVIDTQDRVLDMNPIAEQILGYDQDLLLGRNTTDVFPEYHDLLARFESTPDARVEVTLGHHIYELQITPLPSRSGKLLGQILMLYDITERKQALEDLDAYARTVAHDLKNPLNLVIGYADYLIEEAEEGDELLEIAPEYLGVIAGSSRQMTEIINSLLMLANVRNVEEVETAPVDMAAVVSGAMSRLTKVANENQAEFKLPENWPVAQGYAPWIEEIWANYISNAIKYGGQPPVVMLGADESRNGKLRFWVRDNGQGMTEAERTSLFAEFSRLGRHTSQEGHGLGLSIVQRIAAKLDGSVGAESTVGEGSLFYFTLPVAEKD